MPFDLHPFEDALTERDRGALVTVEGQTAGYIRRNDAKAEPGRLIYRAYTPEGLVHSDIASREPLEFDTEHEAGAFLESAWKQIQSLKTFGGRS